MAVSLQLGQVLTFLIPPSFLILTGVYLGIRFLLRYAEKCDIMHLRQSTQINSNLTDNIFKDVIVKS